MAKKEEKKSTYGEPVRVNQSRKRKNKTKLHTRIPRVLYATNELRNSCMMKENRNKKISTGILRVSTNNGKGKSK